eukprot:m.41799 g.41799  ORF g.41799 m.41799 type:complete len:252 (-) comp11858_c0_seq1:81-836(-)
MSQASLATPTASLHLQSRARVAVAKRAPAADNVLPSKQPKAEPSSVSSVSPKITIRVGHAVKRDQLSPGSTPSATTPVAPSSIQPLPLTNATPPRSSQATPKPGAHQAQTPSRPSSSISSQRSTPSASPRSHSAAQATPPHPSHNFLSVVSSTNPPPTWPAGLEHGGLTKQFAFIEQLAKMGRQNSEDVERKLKESQASLDALKAKNQALENENNSLKNEKQALQKQVDKLTRFKQCIDDATKGYHNNPPF